MVTTDEQYVALCPNCGNPEWMELAEDDGEDIDDYTVARMNYLTPDGNLKFKNIYRKDKTYHDIICASCEAPCVLIPFNSVDKKERMDLYKIDNEARVKYAKSWLILQKLENENNDTQV